MSSWWLGSKPNAYKCLVTLYLHWGPANFIQHESMNPNPPPNRKRHFVSGFCLTFAKMFNKWGFTGRADWNCLPRDSENLWKHKYSLGKWVNSLFTAIGSNVWIPFPGATMSPTVGANKCCPASTNNLQYSCFNDFSWSGNAFFKLHGTPLVYQCFGRDQNWWDQTSKASPVVDGSEC